MVYNNNYPYLQLNHIVLLLYLVSPSSIVSITPQSPSVRRGEGVSFSCNSDAGPSNEYVWLYKPTDLVCSNNNCSDNNFSFNISNEGKWIISITMSL